MGLGANRLFVRIALCGVLVSGLVAAGGSTALADCQETIYVDAYEVHLEPQRDTYRVGDTAVVEGIVTRTDTGEPVAGADFYVYIPPTQGRGFVFGWAESDLNGHAVMRMKLKKGDVKTGPAKIVGRAQEERADATCANVVEYGEAHYDRAFTIKR